MDQVADWLYLYGPSSDTMSQFWVSFLATAIVIIAVTILEPYIKLWNRKRKRRVKSELKKQEKLENRIQNVVWRPANETDRIERNSVLKIIAKGSIKWVLVIGVLIMFYFFGIVPMEKDVENSKINLRTAIGKSLEQFDTMAKMLWQKTGPKLDSWTNCDLKVSTEGRKRAEFICRVKTSYSSAREISQIESVYRNCMIDAGWTVEECGCEQIDDQCVLVFGRNKDCKSLRMRTNKNYFGTDCTWRISDKNQKKLAEIQCGKMASLYGEEKWYEGYADFSRLHGTILTYEICMRNLGWITTPCTGKENKKDECYKISFQESICQKSTREWLSGKRERQPCAEATSWSRRKRQEPQNIRR